MKLVYDIPENLIINNTRIYEFSAFALETLKDGPTFEELCETAGENRRRVARLEFIGYVANLSDDELCEVDAYSANPLGFAYKLAN